MHRRLLFVLALMLLFSACDRAPEETSAPAPAKQASPAVQAAVQSPQEESAEAPSVPVTGPIDLMNQPIELQRFESISEALPVWRQFADQQPTLLLLTASPQLQSPPVDLLEQIDYLAANGTSEAIRTASSRSNPAALMSPSMVVDAALRNHWFNNLVWVLPMRDPEQPLDVEGLRAQFVARGMLSEQEAASLTRNDQTITGVVRDRPLTAGSLAQLGTIDRPVIVHLDLAYFQALYKNEIATPLLQSLYQTLAALKERHLQVLAVTFAYGHLDNQIALDVRFAGEILAALIARPGQLTEPAPANWQRQADSIYLSNFFEKERVDALHKAQEKDDPDAAWVKFSLYHSAAAQKQGEAALGYLAEAVARDPMYAYEYGNLARLAYERNRPDETMRMFSLAAKAFPDDPFITLRIAELAAELGDAKTALHLVEQLEALNWSPYYHGQMPDYLENFRRRLEEVMPREDGAPNDPRTKPE